MHLFFLLLRLFPLFLALVTTYTYAGTRNPDTPPEKYVEFGQNFPFVVRINSFVDKYDLRQRKKIEVTESASAVLIKPHWALTAAHVIQDAKRVSIVTDANRTINAGLFFQHKDYDYAKPSWHDIALCYLDEPVELAFYPGLYRAADEVNQAATIAGWGMTGTFLTGATQHDNKKRAGHNRVDYLLDSAFVCTPSKTHDKFLLEFMIAPGDSGGGLFLGNKLAGINSFLMAEDNNPNGSYTDESVFTRVSLYADWVELQIQEHELALQCRATTTASPANVLTP